MAEADEDAIENTPGYVAPKKVALDDLKNLDKDDEALNRWKAALLAGTGGMNFKMCAHSQPLLVEIPAR